MSALAWPAEAAAIHLEAARVLMARYGADVGHGDRVLGHGRRLLAGAIDAFDHPDRAEAYRLRLDLAALVHDLGRAVAAQDHNRHSRYLVLHSDRTQTWPEELRAHVAELVRAHRGAVRPDKLRRRLDGDRDLVRVAALLRVADGLDRSHVPGVSIVAFGPGGKGFSLVVAGLAARDRRRLVERKADLFPRAFRAPLNVQVDLRAPATAGDEAFAIRDTAATSPGDAT